MISAGHCESSAGHWALGAGHWGHGLKELEIMLHILHRELLLTHARGLVPYCILSLYTY